jgi:hypothetical protein
MKRTEDMGKEERKQFVAGLEGMRREASRRAPLLTPEQSAKCRLPNEAELIAFLGEEERKHQDRYRRWIEQGGRLEGFK